MEHKVATKMKSYLSTLTVKSEEVPLPKPKLSFLSVGLEDWVEEVLSPEELQQILEEQHLKETAKRRQGLLLLELKVRQRMGGKVGETR